MLVSLASWQGPLRQARVRNSSSTSNIQNGKLKLYKTRSQIDPLMHVIPQDMVDCQAPLRPLACRNRLRCFYKTLKRGPILTLKEHRRIFVKGARPSPMFRTSFISH